MALKGGKGYTRDVAKLMGAYADSLENVAAALADIQDPDYSATYGDDDTVTLNLDGAKALRASAMAMASALNIAASYQYGPDSAYVTQQEEVTLPRMHIKDTWGMQPTTTYEESSSTFETQFSQQEIEAGCAGGARRFLPFDRRCQGTVGQGQVAAEGCGEPRSDHRSEQAGRIVDPG